MTGDRDLPVLNPFRGIPDHNPDCLQPRAGRVIALPRCTKRAAPGPGATAGRSLTICRWRYFGLDRAMIARSFARAAPEPADCPLPCRGATAGPHTSGPPLGGVRSTSFRNHGMSAAKSAASRRATVAMLGGLGVLAAVFRGPACGAERDSAWVRSALVIT